MADGEAPPVVEGAKQTGSGIKDLLMKETAGMPNWAWVVIIVAGLGVAYILPRFMGKGNASSASTDSSAAPTDGSGLGLAIDPTTGLPYAVSGLVPAGGSAGNTDNLSSLEAQLNQLLASQSRDEAAIQQLLKQKSPPPSKPTAPPLGGRLPGQGYKPPPGGRIPLARRPSHTDPAWPHIHSGGGPTLTAIQQAAQNYAVAMAGHGEGAIVGQLGGIASTPQPAPQPKHQQLTVKVPDWRTAFRNMGWWWL